MSRKTAKLILYNDVVDSLRDWVADVFFPEEFFYATLATLDRSKLENGEVKQGIFTQSTVAEKVVNTPTT